MNSDFPVVIDACVLVQAAVRDTLLRLAEQRLFLCHWSEDIINETARTLRDRLRLEQASVDYFVSELRKSFPEAWVEDGYKHLVPAMTNDEKDRHVVAAAVKSGSESIITYNLKHFREEDLKLHGISAKHPDTFLTELFYLNPEKVVHTLHEQGAALRKPRSLKEVLDALQTCKCTHFVQLVTDKLELS